MIVKTSEGNVTGSKKVLNYISMLASKASENYYARGLDALGESAQTFADEIYDALRICGYYDD